MLIMVMRWSDDVHRLVLQNKNDYAVLSTQGLTMKGSLLSRPGFRTVSAWRLKLARCILIRFKFLF